MFVQDPTTHVTYRATILSKSTFNSIALLHDLQLFEWETAQQHDITCKYGIYKLDHGFKNAHKVILPGGGTSNFATLTVLTAQGQVACQVDATSTSLGDVVPTCKGLQRRIQDRGAVVS